VEDPFRGTGWVELYGARANAPSVSAHDMFVYLQALGEDAAFRSVQEWEALTGRTMGRSGAPARPSATEGGDAYQAWRRDIRNHFRNVLDEHGLDGLFFPQAGGPITRLVMDPERPDFTPNNHPELPSNITNDLGVPVVTVPFAYYDDGTPFVIAFIGDLWSEAELLSYAYAFEQATKARIAPRLFPRGEGP